MGLSLPWLRIDLLEFQLVRSHRLSLLVEDQEPRTGGSLVNGTNEDFVNTAHVGYRLKDLLEWYDARTRRKKVGGESGG